MSGRVSEIAEKSNIVKLDKGTIEVLATAVSDMSDTKKTELDEISSTIKDVRDKLEDKKWDSVAVSNQNVVDKLDGVKVFSDAINHGLNKIEQLFEKDVFRQVADNSSQTGTALNTKNRTM